MSLVRRSRRKKGARKTINRWKILLHVTRRWPARVTCIDARVPATGGGLGTMYRTMGVLTMASMRRAPRQCGAVASHPPPRSLNQRSTYNKTATRNFNESRFSFISSAFPFRGGRDASFSQCQRHTRIARGDRPIIACTE